MLALTSGIEGSQVVHRCNTLVSVAALHMSVVEAKHLPWEIAAAQGTTAEGEKVLVQQQRGPSAVVQQQRPPETVEGT
jgi:hypothetical protein